MIKTSCVGGIPIINKSGNIKTTKAGKIACKIKPRVICVTDQNCAYIAINSPRTVLKKKICQGGSFSKDDYYKLKLEDFNKKVESANRANQLLKKAQNDNQCEVDTDCGSRGNSIPTEPVSFTDTVEKEFEIFEPKLDPDLPPKVKSDIINQVNRIKEGELPIDTPPPSSCNTNRFKREYLKYLSSVLITKDNNSILIKIPVVENMPVSAIEDIIEEYPPIPDSYYFNPKLLSLYVASLRDYVLNHPKYVELMSKYSFPEEEKNCNEKDTRIVSEECLQFIEVDENGDPLIVDGDFVYKDKDKFLKCVESFNNAMDIELNCPDCNEFIDEYGNPIQPFYMYCITLKCNQKRLVNIVYPDCADYLEFDPQECCYSLIDNQIQYDAILYYNNGETSSSSGNLDLENLKYCPEQNIRILDQTIVFDNGTEAKVIDPFVQVDSIYENGGLWYIHIPDQTLSIETNVFWKNDSNGDPIYSIDGEIYIHESVLQIKPATFKKKDITAIVTYVDDNGSLNEKEMYLYDICVMQKCGSYNPLLLIAEECKNIENPDELIKVDWKCQDCPEELQYVTRLEDCVYQKIKEMVIKEFCPECSNWENEYSSLWECYVDKCKDKICSSCENSLFIKEPFLSIAKEKGFFSNEFIDALYEYVQNPLNFKEYYNYDNTIYEIYGFGDEFKDYLRTIKGLNELIIDSDKEFFSKPYLREVLETNINKCHFMKLNAEESVNPCIERYLDQMNIDVWIQRLREQESDIEVNPEMCLPDIMTLNEIASLKEKGIYPLTINKFENGYYYSEFIIPEKEIVIKRYFYQEVDEEMIRRFAPELIGDPDLKLLKVDVYQNQVKIKTQTNIGKPCDVYENCYSLVLTKEEDEAEEILYKDVISPEDIARIEELLENSCANILDSILQNDTKLQQFFKENGITNEQEKRDYIKFKIFLNTELEALVEYLNTECQEFNTSILDCITNKKSIIEFQPDRVILEGSRTVEVKENEIKSIPFTKTKDRIIEVEAPSFKFVVNEKIILPKLNRAWDVIEEHLKTIEEMDKYKSEEYIESLYLNIFIPEKIIREIEIDSESLQKKLKEIFELEIDTFQFKNKQLPIVASIEISEENTPRIAVTLNLKDLDKLNIKDTDIDTFIYKLKSLQDLKLLEIPIDVFIYNNSKNTVIEVK